jgi:SAM-dependent methyltransferase
MDLDRAAEANRAWWDAVRRQRDAGLIAKNHDVAAQILAGASGPCPEQLAFLGDVAGKRLLDLGCGDGCELVPLARLGAVATGVDNSPVQLATAQRTADALGVRVRLVLADLMRLPEDLLQGQFDLVFSSHVTAWVGDLDRWFGSVRRALVPGGVFVLRGGHPLAGFLAHREDQPAERASYFEQGPFVERAGRSERWNPLGEEHTTVEWTHTLGAIVTAVAQAGLRVTHLTEVGGEPSAAYPDAFVLRATNA